ncbi:MAG TPA: hydroxymethylglutaryl-CoA lyase [Actinomycetes bacterium]|nr:hydroxymethylglutaryl-CoA lyase [Actinomycetes bacterium]
MPGSVSIREVGPRDGLQSEAPLPVEARVRLVDALSGTGVGRIEVGSFVSPKAVPAMAGTDHVFASIRRRPGVVYSALVPNQRGAEDALAARADRLQVVVAASEAYNRRNVNRTVAETLAQIAGVVRLAGPTPVDATVSTAWGCPYEGEVPAARVVGLAERLAALGCRAVSLGDTTGMATPTRVEALLAALDGVVPVTCHFHDTRGTGLANLLAAVQAGCRDFDTAVGGLGGSPTAPGAGGNVASEDAVHMLEDMGVSTGVDLDALLAAARLVGELVGHRLRSQVLVAGPRTRRAGVGAAS